MTPEEFTRRLPPLTNNPLPAKPPFVFNGLSSRVFPLRANLDALQRFCNGYLNFVPESVGRFRASVPYVFLSVLDYGQVGEASGLGWFAQVEVFFAVPLEWYRRDPGTGRWVFHDWATITPFIFVNDNFSVPLGRTVSGFPKVLAKVSSVASEWIHDPLAPVTLAQIETEVFPAAYEGRRLESRVFLEVRREAPMSNLRVPVDPASPIAPWTMAANIAEAAGGLGRDALWLAQAMRIYPLQPFGQPGLLGEMLARGAPALAPGGPGLVTHSLNLKQFRRTEHTDQLCYQALTDGPMVTNAFNSGGLLGEDRTLLGDASGGHTILLREYPTIPIARTLGLEVHRRWRAHSGGTESVDVAELRPVLPFWMDVNVSLMPSVNLAWRGHEGGWKDGCGAPLPHDAKDSPLAAPVEEPPRFNTLLASAVEAITGPFTYAGTTVRVLPLLAHRHLLQAHLDTAINRALAHDPVLHADGRAERLRLTVWARPPAPVNRFAPIGGEHAYVYLTATTFGSVSSDSNNIGDWAKDEVAFLVPVKFEREVDGDWVVEGVGVVPAFFFVDDCMAAVSRYEVQGIDARTATFERPENAWLAPGAAGDHPRHTLLRVAAETWAAAFTGQQATVKPVVEIVRNEPNAGLGAAGTHDAAFAWSELLRLELGTKKGTAARHPGHAKVARALALELLGNRAPLQMYSLKQFRDVVDPDKACYQALVRLPRLIEELHDLCEIEETLTVRVHDYPKLAIVESLGLVGTRLAESGAGVVHSLQALRPFTVRCTLREPLAERLMSRTGSRIWRLAPHAFRGRLGHDGHGPALAASPEAEALQDRMDPCRMTAVMFNARTGNLGASIDADRARRALAVVDAQMVIESVLSREWGNTDARARWRVGRARLAAAVEGLPLDGAAEAALYGDTLAQLSRRQGFPQRLLADAQRAIDSESGFRRALGAVERDYAVVAAWLAGSGGDDAAAPAAWASLLAALRALQALQIAGEPSLHNNLDMLVKGWSIRLDELLSGPELVPMAARPGRGEVALARWTAKARHAAEPLRHAVQQARSLCNAQHEALLNTLSRAFQKPDFCIARAAVGAQRDHLLTTMGSWDEDWYWGKRFDDVTPEAE